MLLVNTHGKDTESALPLLNLLDISSIGGMFYSGFFGGNLIKVGGNKLTSLRS